MVNQKRGHLVPDDGDPWAPNNLPKIRSKRKTPVEPH